MADGNYPPTGQWSSGCCSCFDDCESMCCVWCCPCVAVGRIAEIVDAGESDSSHTCCFWMCIQVLTRCGCLVSCGYRKKLRMKYGLPEQPCSSLPFHDVMMHCCCECCSISQEYRELKARGWDPSLGYEGNKNKSPPPQQFVAR